MQVGDRLDNLNPQKVGVGGRQVGYLDTHIVGVGEAQVGTYTG